MEVTQYPTAPSPLRRCARQSTGREIHRQRRCDAPPTDLVKKLNSQATPDDLYLKVDGSKAWPGGRSRSVKAGERMAVNIGKQFGMGQGTVVSLWDCDSTSDDEHPGSAGISKVAPLTNEFLVSDTKEGSIFALRVKVVRMGPYAWAPLRSARFGLLHGGSASADPAHAASNLANSDLGGPRRRAPPQGIGGALCTAFPPDEDP